MRWLAYINRCLVCLVACTLFAIFWICIHKEESHSVWAAPPPIENTNREPLPSPFAPTESVNWEESSALALKCVLPRLELPDLSTELLYYGRNERPDRPQGETFLVGLKGTEELRSVALGTPLYLSYEAEKEGGLPSRKGRGEPRSGSSGHYLFSPPTETSRLWVELVAQEGSTLTFSTHLLNEKGEEVVAPLEKRTLTIPLQELQGNLPPWEIGGMRVDTTLLARQRARWMGRDLFLERHGGKEFAHTLGKERLDFYDTTTPYACFVGVGEWLIWKNERWVVPAPGEKTGPFSLLQITRLEETLMQMDLWDPSGRKKLSLNLVKTRDPMRLTELTKSLTFIGAKTWSQFTLATVEGKRLTVRSQDWLLLGQEGWTLIDSAEKVDAYVEGRTLGPLLVIDKLSKQSGHQVLLGHLFTISRTEVEEVEWATNETTGLPFSGSFVAPLKIDNQKEE